MIDILIHIMPAIILTFLLQLVLHEAGHMLGGLLSGWRLIYIQIFYIAVVKYRNSFRLTKVGTCGFQCIMYPLDEKNSALLYTAGGVLANLNGAVLGLLIILTCWNNHILCMYAWAFLASGMILFFSNGIPKVKRICNDGACFKLLKSDPITRKIHNSQLLAAKELNAGYTYKKIGLKLISSPECARNDILAYQAVLEYYYWLDEDNDNLGRLAPAALSKAEESTISQSIQDIVKLEKLYYEIIQRLYDMNVNPIDLSEYGNDIRKYIEIHGIKGDVHTERIKTIYDVYECLIRGQSKKALQCIERAVANINKLCCLYPGEKLFCVSQLNKLKVYCI